MKKNPILLTRARELRIDQTDAEQLMWYYLRNRRLGNYKFKRQVPMGNYIVDFICEDKKLIIELDGGQHAEQEQYDHKRTLFLKSEGYRVLRFWNTDALVDLEPVLEMVLMELEAA